jgi:[NiFe] hydrogenase diaphorase moiety large subunit
MFQRQIMSERDRVNNPTDIEAIAAEHGRSRNGLINIVREVQSIEGHISGEAIARIAKALSLSRVEIEDVVSFFHFLSAEPSGQYRLYLNDSVTAVMAGSEDVAAVFEKELGSPFGETTPDGLVTLQRTSCIGMNDQEPAALLNGVVLTRLTPEKAKAVCEAMRRGDDAQSLVKEYGDGVNASERVRAMVRNNIRRPGPVLFAEDAGQPRGEAVRAALDMAPGDVIDVIKDSRLRGRGGAGFPTGMKWDLCGRAPGERRYVICNADEGEPGTFKDRVLLTERAELMLDGMTVAAYAIGASEGILYLRAEYEYLSGHLHHLLEQRRRDGLLGPSIGDKKGFDFDIRIQLGAGAYICGEESALIESMTGRRGAPRDRPPFPTNAGFELQPTVINNVETLCAAARIVVKGAKWFTSFGVGDSRGTKVLSISGDCERPGIYEVPLGTSVREVLEMAGAGKESVQAVQVGGPSGTCISSRETDHKISYEDISTGGSFIIFGQQRDMLAMIQNFMRFFQEESCGWCVPCRVGNLLLADKLDKVIAGRGTEKDLTDLEDWGEIIRATSRCGLGQTSPNPILSSLEHLRDVYAKRLRDEEFVPAFDLKQAASQASDIAGRPPTYL